jgi:hypothetical protein
MAGTRGREGGEVRGIEGIEGRGKEAYIKTNQGTRLIEGTRDFIIGLINQSSAIGRFLFRIGYKGAREINISLTCLKVGTGTLGLVGSIK